MIGLGRRSVLRGSVGLAAAGTLARPYIANAQAKTASVWWVRASSRKRTWRSRSGRRLREGQRQQDRLQHHAVRAERQKIVSAMTSGDVPDIMFHDTPTEAILPQNAWDDKLVDVSDVVETQKAKSARPRCCRPAATTASRRSAAFTACPIKRARPAVPYLGPLVEKAGFKMADIPKTWDAFWDFFKPVQKELRAKGMRKRLCARPADDHRRAERRQQPVPPFPDRQWRPGHRHQGRQAAPRRSEGREAAIKALDLPRRPPTRKAMCRRARSTGTTPTTTTPSTPS